MVSNNKKNYIFPLQGCCFVESFVELFPVKCPVFKSVIFIANADERRFLQTQPVHVIGVYS